jgi:hypothetical protein
MDPLEGLELVAVERLDGLGDARTYGGLGYGHRQPSPVRFNARHCGEISGE